MVISVFLSIYMFILVEETNHGHRHISNITWTKFRDQCGYKQFIKNPRATFRNYEMNYFAK